MKIGVLTSNQHRHTFFANFLAKNLPVGVVVMEPKTASPREVGKGKEEDQILNRYFDERDQVERDILTGGDNLDLPSGVQVVTPLPGKISEAEVLDQLLAQQVDTLAVFGTSILKDPLLAAFRGRIVNIHLGVSPYYRGSGTNFWAMYNEDLHLVGSTIHYIDPGIDTGEIICHVQAPIVDGDTPHTIGNHVIRDSVHGIVRVLQLLGEGPVPSMPQWKAENEHLYRRRDFTADILSDLLSRWEQGLVRRFLKKQAKGHLDNVRILPLPEKAGSTTV